MERFNPLQPSVKTLWHSKMQAAMELLVEQVLNDKHFIISAYHKLSLPTLLGLIGRCSTNLMVVGQRHSWMVNARTSHRRHFIGTKQMFGLASREETETEDARPEICSPGVDHQGLLPAPTGRHGALSSSVSEEQWHPIHNTWLYSAQFKRNQSASLHPEPYPSC